jgi:hypothetical protein
MNVEIGAEAALFPEKECINGIAVAVYHTVSCLGLDDNGENRPMKAGTESMMRLPEQF